jgi:hypothetical protein
MSVVVYIILAIILIPTALTLFGWFAGAVKDLSPKPDVRKIVRIWFLLGLLVVIASIIYSYSHINK